VPKYFIFGSGYGDHSGDGPKDGWVETEMQMRREGGRNAAADAVPLEERPIIDPRTGVQAIHPLTGRPRSRRVRPDSALGFDSTEVHYAGDRVVKLREEPEIKGGKPTGDIDFYFQRYDQDGRSMGTFKQRWHKDSEGRHRSEGKARRIWGGF
jgi:hypothetical protein